MAGAHFPAQSTGADFAAGAAACKGDPDGLMINIITITSINNISIITAIIIVIIGFLRRGVQGWYVTQGSLILGGSLSLPKDFF